MNSSPGKYDLAPRRCIGVQFLTLLLAFLVFATDAHGATIDDTFDGNALDWCRWEDMSNNGTVSQGGELTLSPSGSDLFTSARLQSQARLTGDFDIQVDYRLGAGFSAAITGPNYPALNVTLGLTWDDPHIIYLSRAHNAGGDVVSAYSSLAESMPNNNLFSPTSAQAGALRIVRTAAQIQFFHRPLGAMGWTDIGTMAVPTTPVNVTLTAYNTGIAQGFAAYLDNLKLNSGQTDDIDYVQPAFYTRRPDFALGGVVDNWPAMKYFGGHFATYDPLAAFKANGMDWMRVGVTTTSNPLLDTMPPENWSTLFFGPNIWGTREYAAATLRDAQARGIRLYAYLYFSDGPANWGNQPAPAAWAGKTVAETAVLMEQHAYDTAMYFKNKGLNVEVYEIGNETDIGMVDFLPGRRIVVPPGIDFVNDRKWLRDNVWSIQATLLKAGISGIRRANPSARVAVHAASLEVGRGAQFGPDFFQAMRDFGVDYDIAALSNPYAQGNQAWRLDHYGKTCWFKRISRAVGQIAVPGKPVMIAEASYQSDPATLVSNPMPDFPFTPQGQADWLKEYLRFASNNPSIVGWFYFSPELYSGRVPMDDQAYVLEFGSLLASENVPRPSLAEFRVNLASGTPAIALSPNSLDFGPINVTAPPVTLPVTIANSGSANLTLLSLTLGGAGAADFSIGGTCSAASMLIPAAQCTLNVTFTPGAIGSRNASLAIVTNASVNPTILTLTGRGATTPTAPVMGNAIAGDGLAYLFFTAPASTGGLPIVGYAATCNPGAIVITRNASPITASPLTNNAPYTCSVTASNALGAGAESSLVMVTPATGEPQTPVPIAVQSRKNHGGLGPFNVDIDMTQSFNQMVSVEPRWIGGGHLIAFRFDRTIASPGVVSVIPVGTASATALANEVLVRITNVPDNQRVTVSLTGVDGTGVNVSTSMAFLVGDVNGSGTVNASDISAMKARVGQVTSLANFQFDLNANGSISSQDVSTMKARSGLALP